MTDKVHRYFILPSVAGLLLMLLAWARMNVIVPAAPRIDSSSGTRDEQGQALADVGIGSPKTGGSSPGSVTVECNSIQACETTDRAGHPAPGVSFNVLRPGPVHLAATSYRGTLGCQGSGQSSTPVDLRYEEGLNSAALTTWNPPLTTGEQVSAQWEIGGCSRTSCFDYTMGSGLLPPCPKREPWIMLGDREFCKAPRNGGMPGGMFYGIPPPRENEPDPIDGPIGQEDPPDYSLDGFGDEASTPYRAQETIASYGDEEGFWREFVRDASNDDIKDNVYFTLDQDSNITCIFILVNQCDPTVENLRQFTEMNNDDDAPQCPRGGT